MTGKPRYVYRDGMFDRCPDCNENRWYEGRGRKSVVVCGCTPEPVIKPQTLGRLKSAPTTSQTGRRGEKRTKRLLGLAGVSATATAGSGATGSRNGDKAWDTDLRARLAGMSKRVEVKNLATVPGLTSMVGMLGRSDFLHVQSQGQVGGFWFMPDDQFIELASLAAEAAESAR